MSWRLVWLWFWFLIGMSFYMLKRAYYLVTGPNPVANTYVQFFERCWIPLLCRAFIDSMIFWALFTPGFADRALSFLGWDKFAWAISMVTQFAVFAAVFGNSVDSVIDIAVSKIPWLNGWLPQMPGPPPPPPSN
jgi:hypothetical protein